MKKSKKQPPSPLLIPVQSPPRNTPPEHWFTSVVVTSHNGISEKHLVVGTPIKIKFASGRPVFCLFGGSNLAELVYWKKDGQTPVEQRSDWKSIESVMILSVYDLTQIGKIFAIPLGSPTNGICH